MYVAVTRMGPEAPLSFKDQRTNHWQHHGHCLLCAEEQQVLGQTQQRQDMAGSTLAAPSAWQRQLLWLSSVGSKGPCLPNYSKQHVLFTAPTTSSKITKRGIMMTHEKQNSHNFLKMFGKSSAAGSCANSMECTMINGDLPVHQEQPLSLSRLFLVDCQICDSYQEPVDLICVALYPNVRSHSKIHLNKYLNKTFYKVNQCHFLRNCESAQHY